VASALIMASSVWPTWEEEIPVATTFEGSDAQAELSLVVAVNGYSVAASSPCSMYDPAQIVLPPWQPLLLHIMTPLPWTTVPLVSQSNTCWTDSSVRL